MRLFLITGSSGIGKSTLLPFLKNHLPAEFDVHDFDEKLTKEVAMNGKLVDDWRKKITEYWIDFAKKNLESNKSTIIVGLIYPNEVKQLNTQIPYSFCLLDASDEKIEERLMGKRFSTPQKIAALKEAAGQTPEEFILENRKLMEKLRDEIKIVNGEIIDTAVDTPEQTANKILTWILRK